MIKMVCLFRIKPGLSRDEFIAYYETHHAPLIARLIPQPVRYQRSYLIPGTLLKNSDASAGLSSDGAADDTPFDVMTEAWFDSQAAFDEMLAITNDPEIGRIIAEDEEKFMDLKKNIVFLADERITR